MNDEQNSAVLCLNGIKKVSSTEELETHALSDVHFTVRKGEYVVIEGPSGSGKTTLLSILGLLEKPTAGAYRLNGVDVGTLDGRARARLRNRQIGFIFQTFNLLGELSVWENVELPLIYGGLPSPERRTRVDEALERVQMSHRKITRRASCPAASSAHSRSLVFLVSGAGRHFCREPGFGCRDDRARGWPQHWLSRPVRRFHDLPGFRHRFPPQPNVDGRVGHDGQSRGLPAPRGLHQAIVSSVGIWWWR